MKRIWINNNFKGFYPVGTAAVIIADSVEEARDLLQAELDKLGLKQPTSERPIPLKYFTELSLNEPKAKILNDGNY